MEVPRAWPVGLHNQSLMAGATAEENNGDLSLCAIRRFRPRCRYGEMGAEEFQNTSAHRLIDVANSKGRWKATFSSEEANVPIEAGR